MIKEIKSAVTIPVMAKARIGHFVEAQILEACEIDYIDESREVVAQEAELHDPLAEPAWLARSHGLNKEIFASDNGGDHAGEKEDQIE